MRLETDLSTDTQTYVNSCISWFMKRNLNAARPDDLLASRQDNRMRWTSLTRDAVDVNAGRIFLVLANVKLLSPVCVIRIDTLYNYIRFIRGSWCISYIARICIYLPVKNREIDLEFRNRETDWMCSLISGCSGKRNILNDGTV